MQRSAEKFIKAYQTAAHLCLWVQNRAFCGMWVVSEPISISLSPLIPQIPPQTCLFKHPQKSILGCRKRFSSHYNRLKRKFSFILYFVLGEGQKVYLSPGKICEYRSKLFCGTSPSARVVGRRGAKFVYRLNFSLLGWCVLKTVYKPGHALNVNALYEFPQICIFF